MSKQETKEEKKVVDPFFAVVAKIYGVPETGISAIDKQPYLNKDGRLYLLHKLRNQKGNKVKAIRVEFIKTSTALTEIAIVKKTIVFADGLEVEATGEASKDSVGSQSVKQTLNMVAETRALNRAIWQAIAGEIMERVESNLANMEIDEKDRARIMEAGRVSYEEMERPTAPSETSNQEAKLYAAIVSRVDEVQTDGDKLRVALKKLKTWPLEAEKKAIIEEKIYRYLSKIEKPAKAKERKGKNKKKAVSNKGNAKKKK